MELTQTQIFDITSKSDAASNAFMQTILNEVVELNVVGLGWIKARVITNSQYVIIVQPIESDSDNIPYWQISKSHIVCIKSNSTFSGNFDELVVKGVKEIIFKTLKLFSMIIDSYPSFFQTD